VYGGRKPNFVAGTLWAGARFDGNVVESTTPEGTLKGSGAPAGALVVMNRGIATAPPSTTTSSSSPDASGSRRRPLAGTLQTHPDVYCLRTNELTWDGAQLWRTYMMLTDLEAVFRSCKSELGLRPIFHHKEVRADGPLFITVLAYQLVQLIRRRLHEQALNGQVRVTATFRRPDGRALHVRKATQAESGQRQIYQALGINSSPGGVSKLLV